MSSPRSLDYLFFFAKPRRRPAETAARAPSSAHPAHPARSARAARPASSAAPPQRQSQRQSPPQSQPEPKPQPPRAMLSKPGDIDVRASGAHVQVYSRGGALLADSRGALELDEFRCPTRYYVPRADVRWGALEQVPTTTRCPYKGTCDLYWAARDDELAKPIAWEYAAPLDAVRAIAGRVAFWNEQVRLLVDGVEWRKGNEHSHRGQN